MRKQFAHFRGICGCRKYMTADSDLVQLRLRLDKHVAKCDRNAKIYIYDKKWNELGCYFVVGYDGKTPIESLFTSSTFYVKRCERKLA